MSACISPPPAAAQTGALSSEHSECQEPLGGGEGTSMALSLLGPLSAASSSPGAEKPFWEPRRGVSQAKPAVSFSLIF